jgi:hypothetical protein
MEKLRAAGSAVTSNSPEDNMEDITVFVPRKSQTFIADTVRLLHSGNFRSGTYGFTGN